MGWSCAWGAVRGKPPEVVLDELKLRRTGQACDFADPPISGGAIPGGWFIVAYGRYEGPFFAEDVSRDCEVVEVNIVESAGFWSAAYWKNGEEVWRVTESQESEELSVEGSPPASLDGARRRFRDASAAFERGEEVETEWLQNVPLVLAQELTGFFHDRIPNTDPPAHFEVLESLAPPPPPPPPPKKPWWKPW